MELDDPQKMTPRAAEDMLAKWRATFPEIHRRFEAVQHELTFKRRSPKGPALDKAALRWGCAWLVLGRKGK